MIGYNIFVCSLIALIGVSCVSSYYINPKSKTSSVQADPFDDTYNDYSEEANEMESEIFYNIILNELLNEIDEEEALEGDPEDPQKELEELEAALDTDDGRWLDDITEEKDDLPPNYHNTTEIHTNIGNSDVDIKESIDKSTSKDGKSTKISSFMEAVPETRDQQFQCSLKQPCDDGEYCFETQFYSECMACMEIGSACVDDAQCCSESSSLTMCVKGTCKANVTPGSSGTICDTSDDCQPGHCCAKLENFPQSVCKPLAKLNEQCSPHLNSLSEIMMARPNLYVCPCEKGFICRARSTALYDSPSTKRKFSQTCLSEINDKDGLKMQPNASDEPKEVAPQSGLNNQDTLDPRWQARVEAENDQRFVSPYVLRRHQALKKAIAMESLNDLVM